MTDASQPSVDALNFSIATITFSDGTKIEIDDGAVVVFVGPNNAGKSAALRNILTRIESQEQIPTQVVTALEVRQGGDRDAMDGWLRNYSHTEHETSGKFYRRMGHRERAESLVSMWENGPPFHSLVHFFVFHANAEQRLHASAPTNSLDFAAHPPSHPLHVLYLDDGAEQDMSTICQRAFGVGLTVNRYAGNQIHLHVGEIPTAANLSRAPSKEFMSAVSALPLLHEQGDGMRSFVGLMLSVSAVQYFVTLIDEPEAFLHPPQETLLGRLLGDLKRADNQMFLATHSSNVLKGLLDSRVSDVIVVRLVRDVDINRVSTLPPSAIKELWKDPLLRHSNVLDGLFHRGVVVCEGDGDARFYAAVLNEATATDDSTQQPELLFTHCGGKDRMPVVIRALRAVRVPIHAIADFDVLSDEQPLRRIVETLGGNWPEIAPLWRQVKSAVDGETHPVKVAYVRQEVGGLLDRNDGENLTADTEKQIRSLTRVESSWKRLKRTGISGLPQGDATAKGKELLERLRAIGLFVVEVGELERWVADVSAKGPAWLSGVFERNAHAAATEARAFVEAVASSVLAPQSARPE